MASEAVKKVLAAEEDADKAISAARVKSSEIITSAESQAAVAVQKRISDAKAEADKIRTNNKKKLEEYSSAAEAECNKKISQIRSSAEKNADKAAQLIIEEFFS